MHRLQVTASEKTERKGRYRKPLLWIVTELLAVFLFALAFRTYDSLTHSSQATRVGAKQSPETIAVLPFQDISAATSDSWAIGITDAIISRLTSLQNLAVRPTTSVLKYAKETPEPTEVAKALSVESILEGTYQRSSGVIRHGATDRRSHWNYQVVAAVRSA